MPEISTLPVAPVAPAAPTSAATPQAQPTPGLAGDPAAPSFLTQLRSALASIGLLPQPTAPEPALPTPLLDEDTDDSDLEDILPEALAALGFVPVPAQLLVQPLLVASEVDIRGAVSDMSATPVLAPLAQAAPGDVAEHQQQPTDGVEEPAAADVPGDAEPSAAPKTADLLQHMTPVTPEAQPSLSLNALPEPTVAAEAKPKPSHTQPQADVAGTTDALTAPGAAMQQVTLSQAFGQPTGTSDSQPETTADEAAANGIDPNARTDAPGPSFAAVATAETQRVDAPSEVKPAHVVSQIAHQADLYRLPGGRGVRIQLHPDDLGGVGVTIKYGAAGSLELHVNVEHAATADLVQGGWTQLRDALSLQGIAPERLIMSVTGPSDTNLSGQPSSFRSDGGQASFRQAGQHSQQERGSTAGGAGWTGVSDVEATSEDIRSAAVASNSRIDYRA